jgi:molybdopterin-guanine dinucleotide biosynthesis protein
MSRFTDTKEEEEASFSDDESHEQQHVPAKKARNDLVDSSILIVSGRRKSKPPERLQLTFEADSNYGKDDTSISRSKRKRTTSSSKNKKNETEILHGRNPNLEKSFALNTMALVDFSLIEEFAEHPGDEFVQNNLDLFETSLIYPIQVSLHGPIRFNTHEEYYALPQPYLNTNKNGMPLPLTSNAITLFTMPYFIDSQIVGGYLPVKVFFYAELLGNIKKTGYIFSYHRNSEGFLVIYLSGTEIYGERKQPFELSVCLPRPEDNNVIAILQEKLKETPLLAPSTSNTTTPTNKSTTIASSSSTITATTTTSSTSLKRPRSVSPAVEISLL